MFGALQANLCAIKLVAIDYKDTAQSEGMTVRFPMVKFSGFRASAVPLLIFPLAALLNSFSMTALLLAFGIAGFSGIAGDIGLVQGATLALFYAFSANARNLILADNTGSAAPNLLRARLWLLLPLAGAAYLLGVIIGNASATLALVLILRRASEWIGEIGLARHEQRDQIAIPAQTVMAESATFLLCLLPLFLDWQLALCAVPWALAPLMATRRAHLTAHTSRGHIYIKTLLPHFGSTAIIGTSVYVFRISIVLLVGKVAAGDLFTAFAIGGLIPTIYGQALAPTLAHRFGNRGLPPWLLIIPLGMLAIAAAVSGLAIAQPDWLAALGRPSNFWLAVGLSIGGGALMSVAAGLRTRVIQGERGEDVFGPDLLANVLIATSVPFVFYAFGPQAMGGLYGLSGCLSLVFLAGVGWLNTGTTSAHARPLLFAIAFVLLLPVFVQIQGGLFTSSSFVFDSGGNILALPLPISILALFVGIALLGNYAAAKRTLATLFFTAFLFVTTSLTISHGNALYEGAKLILLAQFLLPMFGLVLGQMYGSATPAPEFERAAMWVLLLVLPAQLIATWTQGYTLLYPKVFFFSIHQHLQYLPMIVVALLMMMSHSLWQVSRFHRIALTILLPISMVYLAASLSWGAMVGAAVSLVCFTAVHLRYAVIKHQTFCVAALAAACAISYTALSESGTLSRVLSKGNEAITTLQWRDKLASYNTQVATSAPAAEATRITHWRFYASAVVESPKALFLGHSTPPDRELHPSAHNYWLDVMYNFGIASTLPLIILLFATIRWLWNGRKYILSNPMLLGTVIAALYLLLFENMLKVGMRQPYPGIITFFIWGLLIARLQRLTKGVEQTAPNT